MTDSIWLGSLQVGDEVAYGYGADCMLTRVSKLTATQIHTADSGKYQRKTGRSIGSGTWSTRWLNPVTPEIKAAIRYKRALQQIRAVVWKDQPFEVLAQCLKVINEAQS